MSEETGDAKPKTKQRAVAPTTKKKKSNARPLSEEARAALFADMPAEDHSHPTHRSTPSSAEEQLQVSAQASKESLQTAIRAAAGADATGAATLVKLGEQKDQIRQIDQNLADINDTQNKTGRVLVGMKSLTGAMKNMFTSDKSPKGQTLFAAGKAYDPSMVTKEGFLIKQGAVVKSWKSRYFVIVKEAAYYYKTQEEAKLAGSPKGRILLAGATVQACEPVKHDKAHCLAVTSPLMQRTFILSAASDADRDTWIGCLKNPGQFHVKGPVELDARSKSPAAADKAAAGAGQVQVKKTAAELVKDEQDEQLDVLSNLVQNLKEKGELVGQELDQQNKILQHVNEVIDKTDARIIKQTAVMKTIT